MLSFHVFSDRTKFPSTSAMFFLQKLAVRDTIANNMLWTNDGTQNQIETNSLILLSLDEKLFSGTAENTRNDL
jgi:hypothetical protein